MAGASIGQPRRRKGGRPAAGPMRSAHGHREKVPSLRRAAPSGAEPTSAWERIRAVVRRIPRGRVATYGQVAELAGLPGHARLVGYALHSLPENTAVPWHRVVNARGGISRRAEPGPEALQRRLLELEGIAFDARGRIDLRRQGWRPRLPRTEPA